MFYNTTNETGADLKLFRVKTKSQDQIVLDIFRRYPDLTPSEAHRHFPNVMTPLTSIRRSVTDLCTVGELRKTNRKRMGTFGRMETVYEIIQRI